MNSLSFLDSYTCFPHPDQALSDPNGLLAIGGDLSLERLQSAYYQGIFPWFNQEDPILWWSPNPRAIFIPGTVHLSHSLKKALKKHQWKITINHAFKEVISACATSRSHQEGTWISQEIQTAYLSLHKIHKAHSIEVWQQDELIGGLYGLGVGQVFCGESMFHYQTNASKAAMIALDQHLQQFGFKLIDAQIMNPHLQSLGATAITRKDFLSLLSHFRDKPVDEACWYPQEVKLEFT